MKFCNLWSKTNVSFKVKTIYRVWVGGARCLLPVFVKFPSTYWPLKLQGQALYQYPTMWMWFIGHFIECF